MAFRVRMENEIEGFAVTGGPRSRVWNGIVADLWDVRCAPKAGGRYVGKDPRFVFLLDMDGKDDGRFMMNRCRRDNCGSSKANRISFVPADIKVHAELSNVSFVRHLDLHFDAGLLGARLVQGFDPHALLDPHLMFEDERLLALARLIAAECDNPDPLHDLYGESLVLALLTDFLKVKREPVRKRSKLAAWQLRAATDYIRQHCLRSIRLEELAELTNLSQSHFSHAFKASTGVPPHQWQMQARIDRVKELMMRPDMALTDIAIAAGFSDQAHFSRVFRKMVGVSPSVWQKIRQ
ncbi:AraC family transcriptional regulator [Agrobacterium rhizogenes]|uniref:helix-turn-helix transcriptional regulator n=1 Tax=Rhizobium rhizogenes TaxID=359 RepID=UPI0022B671EE|nr:AraC family transcriptional regulator [Rhizobium rhizogenes]MCZ7446303.1 AraC family transcriptional regulator [Rhizobium rhizogenes]